MNGSSKQSSKSKHSRRRQRAQAAPPPPPPPLSQPQTIPTYYENKPVSNRRLIFQSPRCVLSDELLFPAPHQWQGDNLRWKLISQQAGKHRQDGVVYHVGPHATPVSLKLGMPKQAAARVRTLHLPATSDCLPVWLDVVSTTFLHLEHLFLNHKVETSHLDEGAESPTTSMRLLRLYVLYRMPNLFSIDGRHVTAEERKFAHPKDPNGLVVNRCDWIENPDTVVEVRLEQDKSSVTPRPAVEVSLTKRLLDYASDESITDGVDLWDSETKSSEDTPSLSLDVRVQEEQENAEATPRLALEVRLATTKNASQHDDELGIRSPYGSEMKIIEDSENDRRTSMHTETDIQRVFQDKLRAIDIPRSESTSAEVQTPRPNVEVRFNSCFPDVDRKNKAHKSLHSSSKHTSRQPDSKNMLGICGNDSKNLMLIDDIEYVAVESSAHVQCDWSNACGSFAMPYFQKNPRILQEAAENSKLRFRSSFRRKGKYDATDAQWSSNGALSKDCESVKEIDDKKSKTAQDASECSINILESKPTTQLLFSSHSMISPLTVASGSSDVPFRRTPASASLTSPFPMQFRHRSTPTSFKGSRELSISTKINAALENSPATPNPPPPPRSSPLHTITRTFDTVDQPFGSSTARASSTKMGRKSGSSHLRVLVVVGKLPCLTP